METEKKEITIDDLRNIIGFEHFSEPELLKIAESIKELALLLNLIPSVDQFLNK